MIIILGVMLFWVVITVGLWLRHWRWYSFIPVGIFIIMFVVDAFSNPISINGVSKIGYVATIIVILDIFVSIGLIIAGNPKYKKNINITRQKSGEKP